MSRATSYNYEIEVDGKTIHPLELSEFGEGEEGRIKIQDGCIIYSARDEIVTTNEVRVTILIQENREYYNIFYQWVKSKAIKDIFIIGRNSAGLAKSTFLLTNCECVFDSRNKFNRKSKTEDIQIFSIIPEYIEEVTT